MRLLWWGAICAVFTVQGAPNKDIRIPKIQMAPNIEQFLDGHARADMLRVDDFRQRDPHDGEPVSRKTAAWIGYDEKNLYAVFVCESPPGQTRARLSRREDVFSDDIVGILLDTYHDRQRGYEFFANPLGVQADATESETEGDDMSFDTLWYSEGRLTTDGYIVLLAIPFRSLRFSAESQQTWGFGLFRSIPTNNETSFWPYVTHKLNGFNQQLGNATGLENISPGRNLQIAPYGAFGRSHFLDNPDRGIPGFRTKADLRAGVDAKAILHNSLTLDVTLNPDFSQVESDDPQVTVNQRWEVYFPEKRPFFLENSSFFSTPESLLFSRRIVDPEFGARLTGKLGRWSLGLLAADDRAPGRTAGPDDPHRGERAVIGVARVRREFARQSNAGIFLSDREFGGGYNRVGAIDTHLKLDEHWVFNAEALTSQTRTVDGVTSGGDAFNVNLNRWSRSWGYDLQYYDRSAGFHTDLGYMPRVDVRQVYQFARYRFHPQSKVLLSWGPSLNLMAGFDHRGVQQDWHSAPSINFEFARATSVGMSHSQSFERFSGINFRPHATGFGGHTEYFKRATLDFGYSFGRRINYDPPDGMAAFLCAGRDFSAQITLRPGSRIKLDEMYYYTRLTGLADHPGTVFVNHLARSRVNYQFTRELSLRLILDYNGTLPNSAMMRCERQKRITGDVLLTYLLHPGTALYVGYTDRLENLGIVGAPPQVQRIGFPSTTTGRQFFAKVSYLLRF